MTSTNQEKPSVYFNGKKLTEGLDYKIIDDGTIILKQILTKKDNLNIYYYPPRSIGEANQKLDRTLNDLRREFIQTVLSEFKRFFGIKKDKNEK